MSKSLVPVNTHSPCGVGPMNPACRSRPQHPVGRRATQRAPSTRPWLRVWPFLLPARSCESVRYATHLPSQDPNRPRHFRSTCQQVESNSRRRSPMRQASTCALRPSSQSERSRIGTVPSECLPGNILRAAKVARKSKKAPRRVNPFQGSRVECVAKITNPTQIFEECSHAKALR